jgi:hypothetical protein
MKLASAVKSFARCLTTKVAKLVVAISAVLAMLVPRVVVEAVDSQLVSGQLFKLKVPLVRGAGSQGELQSARA